MYRVLSSSPTSGCSAHCAWHFACRITVGLGTARRCTKCKVPGTYTGEEHPKQVGDPRRNGISTVLVRLPLWCCTALSLAMVRNGEEATPGVGGLRMAISFVHASHLGHVWPVVWRRRCTVHVVRCALPDADGAVDPDCLHSLGTWVMGDGSLCAGASWSERRRHCRHSPPVRTQQTTHTHPNGALGEYRLFVALVTSAVCGTSIRLNLGEDSMHGRHADQMTPGSSKGMHETGRQSIEYAGQCQFRGENRFVTVERWRPERGFGMADAPWRPAVPLAIPARSQKTNNKFLDQASSSLSERTTAFLASCPHSSSQRCTLPHLCTPPTAPTPSISRHTAFNAADTRSTTRHRSPTVASSPPETPCPASTLPSPRSRPLRPTPPLTRPSSPPMRPPASTAPPLLLVSKLGSGSESIANTHSDADCQCWLIRCLHC